MTHVCIDNKLLYLAKLNKKSKQFTTDELLQQNDYDVLYLHTIICVYIIP